MLGLPLKRLIVGLLLSAKVGGAYGYTWTDETGSLRVRFGPDACYMDAGAASSGEGLTLRSSATPGAGAVFEVPMARAEAPAALPAPSVVVPVSECPVARARPGPPTEPGRVPFSHLESKK